MFAILLLAATTLHRAWQVERVERAPWAAGPPDRGWVGRAVIFGKRAVIARHPLGCGHAAVVRGGSPPDLLFQGALGDRAAIEARRLGIPDPATTFSVTCDSGVFDYHVVGSRLVVALDNDLIWLRRSGGGRQARRRSGSSGCTPTRPGIASC